MKRFLTLRPFGFLLCSALLLSCTNNVFEETADRKDPRALIFDARRALNKRDYTQALEVLESLPADQLLLRDVNFLRASAYAGRCGLEILTVAFELQDLAGGQLLKLLMQIFPGSTPARAQDCVSAQDLLVQIGGASHRNFDENLLLSFISLTKLGAITSAFADQDGDGEPDPGWDHCQEGDFPEEAVRQVGSGLALFLESFSAAGAEIAGSTLEDLEEACAQYPILEEVCSKTDPSSYSPQEIDALRALVAAENFVTVPTPVVGIGIGACSDLQTDCLCL